MAEKHAPAHKISSRPGIGTTARIVQSQPLRFSRVVVGDPMLIVVKYGRKELHAPDFECVLEPGDAIAIGAGQAFDIVNTPGPDGQYQADWLVWSPVLVMAFTPSDPAGAPIDIAMDLGRLTGEFARAIDSALDAIRHPGHIPDAVARHRLVEVLVWIETCGGHFAHRRPETTSGRIRRFVGASPDSMWTAPLVASKLGMSEATLRRRLAHEKTSLSDLIADVRMSAAMQLLQSTDLPVSGIALDVGYGSASRFAIRFRRRFGFAPSAIRGHKRPVAEIANKR